MKRLILILNMSLFFLAGLHSVVFGQVTITGKVVDKGQESLVGVNIIEKGTTNGTVADIDGNYSLTLSDEESVLVFSYVGFLTQEIAINNQSVIDVTLEADMAQLDGVVVVGYGSQRKRDITGSVAIVDTEAMGKSAYTSITDRLQGRVPGVQVVNSGAPGVKGTIKIRGTAFFGDNNPLYVIDGVLTDDSPNLNPNDIESIQILKDASSSAIYGSRAANGVVVITTKKGVEGKPRINVSSSIGIQQVPDRLEMMDAAGWARIANAAHDNDGVSRLTQADDLSHGIDTDWQEEVFNDAAVFQDINMSVSGGGKGSKVYFSVNNTYQEGTIKGPLFDRVNARLNTEFTLFEGLTIGENLTIGKTRTSGQQNLQGVDFDGPPVISSAFGMLPIIPVLDPSKTNGYGHGIPGAATTFTPNPVGIRDLFKNQSSSTRILGNIFLNYKIIDGLEYRFSLGLDANFGREKNYWKNGQIRMTTIHRSGLNESRYESQEVFLENRLTYTKSIGDHNFSVMATYSEQNITANNQGTQIAGGYDAVDPFFQISSTTAPPNAITTSGDEYASAIRSYLGRLTYNYMDKYLLTASARYDGSSKFSEDNRWGLFPSVSGAWNITNESFFDVPVIFDLKLRAGYGEVGNASIGDYEYQSLVYTTASGGVNYNLGPGSASTIGATRGAIVNRDIKWETLKETNIGLDMVLFDGQLELIGDYYFGNLEDLLTEVPLPMTVAPGGGSPTLNAVSMARDGWEVALTYKKMEGDFTYNITANAFHTNNNVTRLPFGVNEFPGDNSISRIGIPLGQLYVMDYQGIYTSQADIDAEGAGYTINGVIPQVGDAKYKDTNGRDENGQLTGTPDGQISFDDDRVIAGNPMPKVQYGLNFESMYKNFDLTVFFQGMGGRDVYNQQYADLNGSTGENYTADYDPYINGSGTHPRPAISEGGGNDFPSTRFIEKGGYLRLKNLQLGYSIPWDKVQNLRVYVSGQNLLKVSNFKGLDPEFEGGVFNPGVYEGGWPNIRTYNVGFNLIF